MPMRKKTNIMSDNQTVRSRREFKPKDGKVENQGRVIRPMKQTWQLFTDSLTMFTDDFMEDRQQPSHQKRKSSFA